METQFSSPQHTSFKGDPCEELKLLATQIRRWGQAALVTMPEEEARMKAAVLKLDAWSTQLAAVSGHVKHTVGRVICELW